MNQDLKVFNTITRTKESFEPLHPPFVGMYVCGPTVYNFVHLGNCRTFTCFDIIYRYLTHIGYKVRYVRNITDVGHLENDADEGEDKIAKKAKLENLEPMEVVQRYTNNFHMVMAQLNNLPPSIEPQATGHIVEQIEMARKIMDNGFAYEVNGSIYFDVRKYNVHHQYGKLSGRVLDELIAGTRELDGQGEKRNPEDFALWKKAAPEHIMRWHSPWGEGFPGWHLECSVMSQKYLGQQFDIHGGGMDLKFPHHECEIAQSVGYCGQEPVKYWLHTNMLTVNGARMSKSAGNGILPHELFTGNHPLLEQAYSPMTFRYALLQTHYRSTMDISNDALKAARKGYTKVINGLRIAKKMHYVPQPNITINNNLVEEINQIIADIYKGMNDDFNTAIALSALLNLLKKINAIHNGQILSASIDEATFQKMIQTYIAFTEEVFGLREEPRTDIDQVMNVLLGVYREAKLNKDFGMVDTLRAQFKTLGIVVKDMKDRIEWAYEE
ncbi:MAG: cysteine--tRNA ligase [Cytophagales bacterium]|nr:cysteine--tRNA ligase [Bernardetiaceae bacterium]MDW8205725.1 cysteine--tRNA ligase [Cytophagales bacterium]